MDGLVHGSVKYLKHQIENRVGGDSMENETLHIHLAGERGDPSSILFLRCSFTTLQGTEVLLAISEKSPRYDVSFSNEILNRRLATASQNSTTIDSSAFLFSYIPFSIGWNTVYEIITLFIHSNFLLLLLFFFNLTQVRLILLYLTEIL